MIQVPQPSEYALPHTSWRPGQWQAVKKLSSKKDGDVVILQAPVGSGKSSLAKATGASSEMRIEVVLNSSGEPRYTPGVTTLVKTKALQDSVYKELNFDILFGRGNYPCVHPDRLTEDAKASDCLYETAMNKCEYARECPYLVQKHLVQQSSYRSLNYSYLMTAKWPRMSEYVTEYIFYDECHMLPDETLEFVSCTVRDAERQRYDLPEFPSVYDSGKENIGICLKWLQGSLGKISEYVRRIDGDDPQSKAKKSRAERLFSKLAMTERAMSMNGEDWYTRSGARAVQFKENMLPGFVAKPLTARHHFPRLFLNIYPKTVLMSATIGNVEDFTAELGISKYDFEQVPNQWPAESRPVHVLDVPPMGRSAKESAFDLQASKISSALKELPQDWSGIIHVTSWAQANSLVQRLIKKGVSSQRLHVPSGGGTNRQLAEWNVVKKNGRGMLVVTPSMNAGVDLLEERICIVAKVPFPYFAPGTYESERMNYSNRFYRWQTASDLEQRCGRTRRGNVGDYDTSFERNGYVCIADGSFKKMGMAKSCSEDFRDSLVYE